MRGGFEIQSRGLRNTLSFLGLLSILTAAGCRQDMHDQPKFFPQRGTSFYADGRSVRPQVTGTVARSQGDPTSYLHTGMIDGKEGDVMPFAATADVLARGQERYNIYCTPCHSRVGNGVGMIVQRGYYPAGNFHTLRLQSAPLGHFFTVMTNGLGAMPDYAAQLTPEDRWAVAAYIRALQLSQHATRADVPAGTPVENLKDIAAREGLPDSFAEPWTAPAMTSVQTAVQAIHAAPIATPELASSTPMPPAATPTPSATTASPTVPIPTAKQTASAAGAATAKAEAPAEPKPVVHAAPKRDVAAGQAIYMKNCSMCHQPTRAGMPPVIPALIGIVDKVGEDHIRSVVTTGIPTGKPPMPSFADKLSADDINNLLGFLNTK
ncbi:c-type cytochrome [Granulicella sp. WH15]|uniref:c-type cytochrome n=1 Tax=Granulicella sp. WH15 TaxID=2602070 RepID=UPI0013671400|nr:c-type cytochrome [Granulicella sp. WH15]QHN02412.1 c-type cytochrome [Granulicella sp. WH15]